MGRNGRCTEQGFLEFHHVTPYATGGRPTADNIQLRCRAHNAYEAVLDFGPIKEQIAREVRAIYLIPDEKSLEMKGPRTLPHSDNSIRSAPRRGLEAIPEEPEDGGVL